MKEQSLGINEIEMRILAIEIVKQKNIENPFNTENRAFQDWHWLDRFLNHNPYLSYTQNQLLQNRRWR